MNKQKCDYFLLFLALSLVAFGTVMIYSASFYVTEQRWGDGQLFFTRQIMWAIVGIIAMLLASAADYKFLRRFSRLFLFIGFALLVLVLLIGEERNFARRWLDVAGITFQPSEVARFALVYYFAHSMAKRKEQMRSFWRGICPYVIIMSVYFSLILIQPNLSMAGTVAILTLVMLYVAGTKKWHLTLLAVAGIFAAVLFVQSEDYRWDRWTAFLDPWKDPLGDGFQLVQSLYALGAGGIFGAGLGQSRQKLLFLPHSETDFIFSIIGEELGFVGAFILMIIFAVLIWRAIKISLNAPDMYSSLLGAGITSIISIQLVINIAVVTGSMPPTGLPLPFISYGGSSLVFFMIGIGLLLNISKQEKPEQT